MCFSVVNESYHSNQSKRILIWLGHHNVTNTLNTHLKLFIASPLIILDTSSSILKEKWHLRFEDVLMRNQGFVSNVLKGWRRA